MRFRVVFITLVNRHQDSYIEKYSNSLDSILTTLAIHTNVGYETSATRQSLDYCLGQLLFCFYSA